VIKERLRDELARPVPRPDVQLAVALSLATRIESELVRAVRLAVFPHLGVGAESDFWFSEWVGARQPRVVALRPDLLGVLRDRLGGFDRPTLETLRAVIARTHVNLSPALALEEEVTWHACAGGETGLATACALLRRASRAIRVDLRDGVAGWVVGAMRRLPPEVLQSTDGWHLVLNARSLRADDISAQPSDIDDRVIEDILIPVAHDAGDAMRRVIGARWDDGQLVLGEGVEGGITIRLPHHVPPFVEVFERGRSQGRWLDLTRWCPFRPLGPGAVRLRTLDGRVFEIPEAVGNTVDASPVLVQLAGVRGEAAQVWLQPVRFEPDAAERARQPVALLMKVLDSVPVNPVALASLHDWLEQDDVSAVRLLHGSSEDHRVRLAKQIAAESERAGWRVYRGRQDPAAASWLGEQDKPLAGSSGILLVVDRSESWLPEHLRGLLKALLDGRTRTRVLLLSQDAGAWWTAIARTFAASEVKWADQKLVPSGDAEPDRNVVAGLPEDREVAAALTTMAQRYGDVRAAKVLLCEEHLYREREEADQSEQLAGLVFLATLLRPLHVGAARTLCVHFGLIDTEDAWLPLLAAYERLYPFDHEALDPLGPCQLADHLLAGVLMEAETGFGVDPVWARRLVSSIAESSFPRQAVARPVEAHSVEALGHAATRYPELAVRYLNPLVRKRPDLVMEAGRTAIMLIVPHADVELLEVLSTAAPPAAQRQVHLDPAIAHVEQLLVRRLLKHGRPSPRRDAPLRLRLARSQYRAGMPERALSSAERAAGDYRSLVASDAKQYTAGLCEALIMQSVLLGELNEPARALRLAQEAETTLSKAQLREWDRPDANLGTALANLGRQKAKAGYTSGLQDVTQAVQILRGLARAQPVQYEPELAEVLVNQSNRAAEAGRDDLALAAAEEAVDLTTRLYEANEWAHVHRHAAAHACLAARLPVTEALTHATQAVDLYRKAAQATPDRFEPLLAGVLTQYARVQSDREQALPAVEEAIRLYERHERAERLGAVALRERWKGRSA
jgi:tetratricopeptide (TPR) repeat protein